MSPAALTAGVCVALVAAAARLDHLGRRRGRVRARFEARREVDHAWPAWLPATWGSALQRGGMAPGRRPALAAAVVGGVALVALGRAGGVPGVVGGLLALGLAGPLLARWSGGREVRAQTAALPLALEEVSRSLRAGRSLRQAIAETGTRLPGALGAELAQIARLAADGLPLTDAVAWWRSARPAREVRLACAALTLCARAGGEPARALDGVAATIRAEQALAGEVRAQSAQARLSAVCITLAPLLFTGLTCLGDEATATFLFRTRAGWACLAVGLGLDLLAAVWMRRILAGPR